MSNRMKSSLLIYLFGKDYLTDERLQSGIDKAGNNSFLFVMILLWLALLSGLIFRRIDLTTIPLIILFLSAVLWIILFHLGMKFMVKRSYTILDKKIDETAPEDM